MNEFEVLIVVMETGKTYLIYSTCHRILSEWTCHICLLTQAQNIKNFKSQRWQYLLNFNSQRRLLLTGTPLQNSLMELWSLMHFLMPHLFQSHKDFKEWFSNPLSGMIEGSREYNEGLIKRLHKVGFSLVQYYTLCFQVISPRNWQTSNPSGFWQPLVTLSRMQNHCVVMFMFMIQL